MATTYPLSLPSNNKFSSVTFRKPVVAGSSESPFTYQRQVYLWPGERWEADIHLVAMKRSDYAAWAAFLLALDGPVGTFLMGDRNATTPLGSAASNAGTPVVAGADQTGESLAISGLPHNATNYLRAGDYVQLGTGASTRLFMQTADVSSDGSGNATLTLRPRIKAAPADGSSVVVSNTLGIWQLVNATNEWSWDNNGFASIAFSVKEPR